jgi:hypothetical protein
MKFLKILALSVALLTTVQAVQKPSAHTKGKPTGKPTGQLKPGEYWWKPQLSPSGPLMVLVTSKGGTVVVGDGKTPVPHLASNPGLMLAPKDFTPEMLRALAHNLLRMPFACVGLDWARPLFLFH